jgi:uncharacterized protein
MDRWRPTFRTCASIIACVMSTLSTSTLAQATQLVTPRGARIEVLAEFPAGATGPVATVVLAPGSSYPMRQPLMAATARELLARGIAVWRFDWAYTTRQPAGRPSPDLADEREDMRTVVDKARQDARVASDSLFVAGKSLGSGIAWQVLRADAALRGAVLLTPVCSERKGETVAAIGEENYPGLRQERRPLLLVAGDQDPVCEPATLYRFAATAGGPTRVAVIGGNHGFEQPGRAGDAGTRNVERAGELVADFIQDHRQ